MKSRLIPATIAFALLVADHARAGDIVTPPLSTGAGSATAAPAVNCRVLNTTQSVINNVTITLFNDVGIEQQTVTGSVVNSRTLSLTDTTPEGIVYCRVSGISKKQARVILCLLDGASNKAKCTESAVGS